MTAALHGHLLRYTHPGYVDRLFPLASTPFEIAGKNRVWRKLVPPPSVPDQLSASTAVGGGGVGAGHQQHHK